MSTLPLSAAARDLEGCPAVRRVVVLATLPRTGSQLLSSALGETGHVGVPGEYLLGMHLAGFRARLGVPRPDALGTIAQAVRRLRGVPTWQETAHVTRT